MRLEGKIIKEKSFKVSVLFKNGLYRVLVSSSRETRRY